MSGQDERRLSETDPIAPGCARVILCVETHDGAVKERIVAEGNVSELLTNFGGILGTMAKAVRTLVMKKSMGKLVNGQGIPVVSDSPDA